MPYCRELELMCKATAHTPYGDIEHDEFLANGLKCGSHTRLVSATWHIYAQNYGRTEFTLLLYSCDSPHFLVEVESYSDSQLFFEGF